MTERNDHSVSEGGQPAGAGLNLDDVLFTLFRHKWILLAFTILGVVAVVAVVKVKPPQYESKAALMVRYVLDLHRLDAPNPDAIMPLISENIITAEVEILKSLDVSIKAAELVGPEKVLAKVGGGNAVMPAAGTIRSGITVDPPKGTIIPVTFRHADRAIVEPVLRALIQSYFDEHKRARGADPETIENYVRQRDELHRQLSVIEEDLKKLKTDARVFSVEAAKLAYQKQIERLTDELLSAKTQLAEARVIGGDEANPSINSTNAPGLALPPEEEIKSYGAVLEQLEYFQRREKDYRMQRLAEEHPFVKDARAQIADLMQQKAGLEVKFPALASYESVARRYAGTNGVDLAGGLLLIRKLDARVRELEALLVEQQAQASTVMSIEPAVAQLERRRELVQKDYQFFLTTIDEIRRGDAEAEGKLGNVTIVQHPSPPRLDKQKLLKLIGAAFMGCFGCGVGLAFLIDYVFDRTIRRSADVRKHLRIPLFLWIPDITRVGGLQSRRGRRDRRSTRFVPSLEANGTAGQDENGLAPWEPGHQLQSFTEGLRERLITYFEVNQMSHKPKLVGLTGCGTGSGVTTLASGLASALSKTGDGNVLLVDMNTGQGTAHAFYKGEPGCGLVDALEPGGRAEAQVQENLFLASMGTSGSDKLTKVARAGFANLVPKLKASDYDYIIFDMPPVSQTSVTPRLASHMDIVLLVLESEKTGQQMARHATELMRDSRANVAAVLNKCRQHVPARLAQG